MKLKLIEGAGIRKAKNQKFKANFRPLKNLLKARQNAQERSGRTQKGGQGQNLDEFRMSC